MDKAKIEFDFSEFRAFVERLKQAGAGDFKKALPLFLKSLGYDFLRVVQEEIMRRKVIDTRLLLESFHIGNSENLWELDEDGLTLEVGSILNYAAYANDGHWTNPEGVDVRFVPGHWQGARFIYEPGAKTGMILRQKWIEGAHYWEGAIKIIEKMMPELLDSLVQKWIDEYFSDYV